MAGLLVFLSFILLSLPRMAYSWLYLGYGEFIRSWESALLLHFNADGTAKKVERRFQLETATRESKIHWSKNRIWRFQSCLGSLFTHLKNSTVLLTARIDTMS
ncbi:hypothetical protein DFH06DRAFT_1176402 [Mycena polygramma]|nr:hypothetical protein DFH06DRAFT_1176402 [Mycena polygramma]